MSVVRWVWIWTGAVRSSAARTAAAEWCGERSERSVTECLVCCGAGRSRTERWRLQRTDGCGGLCDRASSALVLISEPSFYHTPGHRQVRVWRVGGGFSLQRPGNPAAASGQRSRIPDSGKHRLLLHQPGGGAHRTCERRFNPGTALQMVVTSAASRMRRSLVSRAAPCTCALATMIRSAGSR